MIGGLFWTTPATQRTTSVVLAHVESHPVIKVYHTIPVTIVEMFLLPLFFVYCLLQLSWGVTNLTVTVRNVSVAIVFCILFAPIKLGCNKSNRDRNLRLINNSGVIR